MSRSRTLLQRAGIAGRRSQDGFSMIEVLIALVVLAVGLLGLALLQTVNLRYTKSAQQRTMAVNLAGELLDTMRTNRSELARYSIAPDGFGDVSVNAGGCPSATALTSAGNLARWKCEVRESLGPDATAIVDVSLAPQVRIIVQWTEDGVAALTGDGQVELSTTL